MLLIKKNYFQRLRVNIASDTEDIGWCRTYFLIIITRLWVEMFVKMKVGT